jgi:4-diphosphocytidyl-2-C-methyl-D-erythritol kinase
MLSVFAPAKINLYLHVTGRRPDGYHTLDSIAVFADIGDGVALTEAEDFSFDVTGAFAKDLPEADRGDSNIVVKAAKAYADLTGRKLRCRITLVKNLPVAAGLGGGSSDAAAALRALAQWWEFDEMFGQDFLLSLGADVPMCMAARPVRVGGIGEVIGTLSMPQMPAVLVNPGRPCLTAEVFRRCRVHSGPAAGDWRAMGNDLQAPAIEIVPEIETVLAALRGSGAGISRMSGSGATCFGIYESVEAAEKAAVKLSGACPGWWVRSGLLNP